MKLFEGKSPTERNKLIAAIALGVLALLALSYTFILPMFSGKKTTTTSTSPTPKATNSPNSTTRVEMPTQAEINSLYTSIPISYNPNSLFAPEAGRNIFAFYEPPPPTPYSPTPIPNPTAFVEVIVTPIPTPTPPITLFSAGPANGAVIYAGQNGFRIEANGDKFTPETRIIVNGVALATVFVSPQKLTAELSADYIRNAGNLVITVATPDGKLYSNPVSFNIQAAPQPQFRYIGVTIRKGNNNNTATIKETIGGKDIESNMRLNDEIGGRFRITSISKNEIKVQDKFLGFEYRKPIEAIGQTSSTTNTRTNPTNSNNPNNPNQTDCIPGIPCNIPRFNPNNTTNPTLQQQQQQKDKQSKDDYDDDDGDN